MTKKELMEELAPHPDDMEVIYEDYENGDVTIEVVEIDTRWNYQTKTAYQVLVVK